MEPLICPQDFDDDAPQDVADALEAVKAQLFSRPLPGTPAAVLAPAEKMWLLRAAGVPMEQRFEGLKVWMETTVPCAIVDRGDGTYIIAVAKPCGGIRTR